jgi:hypothetical protein
MIRPRPIPMALGLTSLAAVFAVVAMSSPEPEPGDAWPGSAPVASPASTGAAGSPASPLLEDDRAAVLQVVERLFDGMRARSAREVASVFHPEARMVRTAEGPGGSPRVQVTGVEAFVEAVGSGSEPWNEPLFDTQVQVDQNLAQVWTFYRFYAGETFSHCGHNAILLVRDAEADGGTPEWRIIQIADTRHVDAEVCRR